MGGSVNEISTEAGMNEALEKAGSQLVVIDFTASWCGPCRMIAPKYKELAKEFDQVVFLKVDVDENSETSEKYKVEAMPTFVFVKNSQEETLNQRKVPEWIVTEEFETRCLKLSRWPGSAVQVKLNCEKRFKEMFDLKK